MQRFLRIAGGAFLVAMLLMPSLASAYRFAPGYPRWSFKDMPIKFYVTFTNSGSDWGGRSEQAVEKMVKNAIEMWNQSSCHSVVLKYGGTTKLLAGEKDGKNVITWVGGLPGVTWPKIIATTSRFTARSGGKLQIIESDIRIKKCSKSEPILSLYIARHIGEALGFASNNVPGSLMYRTTTGSSKFHEDDKNAICTAYPAAGNSCSAPKDCPGGLGCISGKCAPCQQNDQCGSNATCEEGTCVLSCKSSKECNGGQVCRGGKCQGCLSDKECGSKAYCDEDVCLPSCFSNDDCSTDEECKSDGRCVTKGGCETHKHCKSSQYCQNSKCTDKSLLGKACKGESDCITGQICMTDQGKSFCTFWCNKQGTACPGGYKCAPFDDERGFCTIDNSPKPTDNKGGDKGGDNGGGDSGGGCSVSSSSGPNSSGLMFLFGVFFFLTLLRRRVRR